MILPLGVKYSMCDLHPEIPSFFINLSVNQEETFSWY